MCDAVPFVTSFDRLNEDHKPHMEHPVEEMRHAAEHFSEGLNKAAYVGVGVRICELKRCKFSDALFFCFSQTMKCRHREWHHSTTNEHAPGPGGAAEELHEAGDHLKSGAKGVVQKIKKWISNKQ